MDPRDLEERVAELERQLAEAKATAWRAQRGARRDATAPADFANQSYSQPDSDRMPLAHARRRVSIRFLLAELLPFRWWYLFALFMVSIPPIIVWIMAPALFLPATVLTLLAIYAIHVRGARTRLSLLKWGQVATVTDAPLPARRLSGRAHRRWPRVHRRRRLGRSAQTGARPRPAAPALRGVSHFEAARDLGLAPGSDHGAPRCPDTPRTG